MAVILIGLCGLAGSGKTTAAAALERRFGFSRLAIANPIKVMLREGLHLTRSQLWGEQKEDPIEDRFGLTGRELMCSLGDWGRSMHRDLWLQMLGEAVDRQTYYMGLARIETGGPLGVVIEDVRLPEEADWLRARGGLLVHIRRPDWDSRSDHVTERGAEHRDGEPIVCNDGTLEALERKIEHVITDYMARMDA